ncbi:MAG TPA: hypothetical protein VHR72_05705 [Gemmataceae bacterium]|nr:hypothetical protein [Gemmataceae bacterium]
MKTASLLESAADPQAKADNEVVFQCMVDRVPVPDDVARRVDARAAEIMERLRRTVGEIDVDQLLRDARDEE